VGLVGWCLFLLIILSLPNLRVGLEQVHEGHEAHCHGRAMPPGFGPPDAGRNAETFAAAV
jgi:hypothetical protein